jgi:hypothetical protein
MSQSPSATVFLGLIGCGWCFHVKMLKKMPYVWYHIIKTSLSSRQLCLEPMKKKTVCSLEPKKFVYLFDGTVRAVTLKPQQQQELFCL